MNSRGASLSLAALHVSAALWRGALPARRWRVAGLNGTPAVRRRLAWLAERLVADPEVPSALTEALGEISWYADEPTVIRAACHELVARVSDRRAARAVVRLVVVQQLAARLGHWPCEPEQADDARVAASLYGERPSVPVTSLGILLDRARKLHMAGREVAALAHWLAADRLFRMPGPLIHAAVLLSRSGLRRSACWALRAAMLEPAGRFATPAIFDDVRRLSAQLALAVASARAPSADVLRRMEVLDACVLRAGSASPAALAPQWRRWATQTWVAAVVPAEPMSAFRSSARLSPERLRVDTAGSPR